MGVVCAVAMHTHLARTAAAPPVWWASELASQPAGEPINWDCIDGLHLLVVFREEGANGRHQLIPFKFEPGAGRSRLARAQIRRRYKSPGHAQADQGLRPNQSGRAEVSFCGLPADLLAAIDAAWGRGRMSWKKGLEAASQPFFSSLSLSPSLSIPGR